MTYSFPLYGRGVALLWKIILTRLWIAIGLVCQLPIDVNIGVCHKPFLRECPAIIVLHFVKE
jgi:hypothetical protein